MDNRGSRLCGGSLLEESRLAYGRGDMEESVRSRRGSGWLGILFVLMFMPIALSSEASVSLRHFGDVVEITHLAFYPDTLTFPGDNFAVLVIQNREDGPIQHEVLSRDLFQSDAMISVQGTGTIEYAETQVSRILLSPGEEAVIWFYARKGHTYHFQCNLNVLSPGTGKPLLFCAGPIAALPICAHGGSTSRPFRSAPATAAPPGSHAASSA